MTVKIIGAGMAGLLAANLLRHHNPVVIEAQKNLPNNHHAVLRFRTPLVGEALGIEFKKVTVVKGVKPWKNPVADALSYSFKNAGTFRSDRSILSGDEVVERYIAPPDLIRQMAEGLRIEYGAHHDFSSDEKVISTIPMPNLMKCLAYPKQIHFSSEPGINIKATISHCDAYVSLAVPSPDYAFSRISITGNELIAEIPRRREIIGRDQAQFYADQAANLLGIRPEFVGEATAHVSQYQKIVPIDDHERKSFIFWASTIEQKAFSLGRFATWRPKLLMDDLVKDIRLIDGWIRNGTPGSSPHLNLHYMGGKL